MAPSSDDGSTTVDRGNTFTRTGNTVLTDSSHPFYLHPSDSPGIVFVNSIFGRKSYGDWRRAIVIALSAINKIGFIDGSIKEPDSNSPSFKAWNRCNDMVISSLLNSLSKDIVDSVLYSKTAMDIWTELEARFGQCNGAQLYRLQKELSEMIQGSSDMASYYTKMKKIWDELDTTCVHYSCDCTCGGKAKTLKPLQDGRLIQFLIGLNETYGALRSSILMLSSLPTVNQAYSLLIQDETQREIYIGVHSVESAFMASQQQFHSQKNREGKFKGTLNANKSNMFFNYCKKLGHTIDKCYRIVGFPPDFKFTKSKKY
ncbi:uncharacterized protein LOC142166492 [Nicotiana tabacum]|uniref:Uncharacterized protein LOC142166492 n=1 Tax=Nicotiana tabacum TaxID=4097 RepID=A0AC58SAI6_TOBAC